MKVSFARKPKTESAPTEAQETETQAAEAKPRARASRPAPRTVPPAENNETPTTAVSGGTPPTIDAESGEVVNDAAPTPEKEAAASTPQPRTRARRPAAKPEPSPEPEQEAPKARPAKNNCTAVGRPQKPLEVGGFRDDPDDVDPADLVLPRLNIVQKVGELSESFEAGVLLLGKTVELANPCRLLLVGFRSLQFVERVPGGAPGRILNSLEEVAEAGGTTDYNEAEDRDIPLFQRMATAMVVIEAPADASAEELNYFPFEFDGCHYALALWSMKGTAYTHAAKHFKTARRAGVFKGKFTRHLKAGYINQFVTLGTEVKKYGRNFAAIPVMELDEPTTPEFRAWLSEVLQGSQAAAEAADNGDGTED